MSGLKVNIKKTKIGWFGVKSNSKIKLCPELKLEWIYKFRLLGITFTTDLAGIGDINYKNKIDDIKKLFKNWQYRYLTPYGKITVIKSLALSKLIHLVCVLPSLNKK